MWGWPRRENRRQNLVGIFIVFYKANKIEAQRNQDGETLSVTEIL